MRLPASREQHPQIIVNLRRRRDGRARIAAPAALFNCHRRGKPLDEIHIRLLDLVEELPRIRRQTLHITPLPLREQRIER